ncbi:hypothetical protein V8F20_011197 [Naviculisporaceae sp. PSN 640]
MEEAIDPSFYVEMDDSLFGSPVDASFTPGRNHYNAEFSFDAPKTDKANKTDNKGDEEISPGTVVKTPAVLSLPLPAPATTTAPPSTQTSTPNPPALELDIPEDAGQSLFVQQDLPEGDIADIEFPDLSYLIPQSAIGQLLNPLNQDNIWDITKPQTETQIQPQTQSQPQFDFSQWQIGNTNAFQFPDLGFQQQTTSAPSFQPIYYPQQPHAPQTTTYDPTTLPALPSPSTPRRSPRHARTKNPSTFSTASSSIILSHLPPSPPPLTVPKKIDHKRNLKNAEDNRPQDIYKPRPPKSKWGPFRYQDVGVELYPLLYFTSDQIVDFITNREANKRRKLTIWIQNAPAQVNQRYHMGTNSSKCRWAHCPGPRNTILKGFWRVAFDEDSDQTGKRYDPFLNAGYMHLFCFEEVFNLGFMIHASRYLGFKVEPDVRDFPYESRNPMSITRDHEELLGVYKKFAKTEGEKYPVLRDERQLQSLGRQWIKSMAFSPAGKDIKSEERLWRQLTDAHLSREVATRHATRENRGGANIGQHRGDLRLYMRLKKMGGAPIDLEIPEPAGQKKRKRGAAHVSTEEEGEENGNGNGPRPTRRIRRGNVPNPLVIPTHHQQAVTRGGDLDGDYDIDYSGLNPPSAIPRHMLSHINTNHPRGKESEIIMDVITSPVRMTRRTSQALQTRLNNQPKFVQKQVLTMIPEHMKEIFFDGNGNGNGTANPADIFGQQSSSHFLEQRLANLPTKVRVEVDEFARRREKNAREFSSL